MGWGAKTTSDSVEQSGVDHSVRARRERMEENGGESEMSCFYRVILLIKKFQLFKFIFIFFIFSIEKRGMSMLWEDACSGDQKFHICI